MTDQTQKPVMTALEETKTAGEIINDFISKDTDTLAEIIKKYQKQIPVPVIAEWWGCDENTVRTALEDHGLLGISERKAGKLNRGFVIPTGHFVRWYMCVWHF